MVAANAGPVMNTRLVQALTQWQAAREEASRYNRNLLQFAAGIGAVIGIGLGGSGLLAIADSVGGDGANGSLSSGEEAIFWVVIAVTALAVLVLSYHLALAYRARARAEREVARWMYELISLVPERFLPKPED